MSRIVRMGWAGLLLWGLSLLSAPPAVAALSANDLNAELLKTRDEVKVPLVTWQAAVTQKTGDDFDSVKAKLAETWKKGRADAVDAAIAKLGAHRQEIADLLSGDPERLDRVSKTLKEQFDSRQQALKDAGTKFDEDAAAFQVPTGSDAKDKSLKKLAELTKAALAPVSDAEWGKVFESVKTAFAEPTAEDKAKAADASVQEAGVSVQKFIDSVEKDFAETVHCTYSGKTGTLVCDHAIAISAAEISTIEISGLPHDKKVTISARAAKDAPTEHTDGGEINPESDSIELPAGQADEVSIDVHLRRRFFSTYREGFKHPKGRTTDSNGKAKDERVLAAETLRQPVGNAPRRSMILIVSGRAPRIIVQVKVENGIEPGQLVTTSLELGYARWGVDTGGFFAITSISDDQLDTEPVAGSSPSKVKVTRISGGGGKSEDTGIFLNLVPKNYPVFGIGIGFSANKEQANTFYLGPSVRLLTFRNVAVASFSLGATIRSVKRFPGLKDGTEVNADDPRLQGKSQLKVSGYGILQLGFSFGRVPGKG